MEVIGLNNYAPPLYSAEIRVLFLCGAACPVEFTPQARLFNWGGLCVKHGVFGSEKPEKV
jgi:hypothetical protein